jgi:hypothetical protein
MAKDETASKRLIRPKTPEGYLARLRQFEPRPIPFADLQAYDVRVQREKRIDDVLSKFMAPYIRDATKLEPFLNDAKRAIAGYVGARETEYDRRKAKKLLSATLIALEPTKRKLEEIAQWPELSNYLKHVYRDATHAEEKAAWGWNWWNYYLETMTFAQMVAAGIIVPNGEYRPNRDGKLEPVYIPNPDLSEDERRERRPEPSSRKQVKQEFQRSAALARIYSDFAPDQIALCLSHLETVLSLAAERVTFGPGDAQRDQIAQDFTDQLASAWRRATKTLPTCSRLTPHLKNPSPFALLLKTINQELLQDRHRSKNDFLEYGIKSVRGLRQFLALRALADVTLSKGRNPPPDYQLPQGIKVVKAGAWQEELKRSNVLDGNISARFKELCKGLAARNLIGSRDDLVWATSVTVCSFVEDD